MGGRGFNFCKRLQATHTQSRLSLGFILVICGLLSNCVKPNILSNPLPIIKRRSCGVTEKEGKDVTERNGISCWPFLKIMPPTVRITGCLAYPLGCLTTYSYVNLYIASHINIILSLNYTQLRCIY
jgi:hypothetical protein